MSSGDFDQKPGQPGWPGPGDPGRQYGQAGQYGQTGPPGAYGAGPGGQSGWQGGPYPYGSPGANWAVGPRRTNSLAIAALCCGIAQVIAGPFSGIPAIVLGAMSLKQIRQTGEDGHGMAVTGIALGIVGTILAVILIVIFVAIWAKVSTQPGY